MHCLFPLYEDRSQGMSQILWNQGEKRPHCGAHILCIAFENLHSAYGGRKANNNNNKPTKTKNEKVW